MLQLSIEIWKLKKENFIIFLTTMIGGIFNVSRSFYDELSKAFRKAIRMQILISRLIKISVRLKKVEAIVSSSIMLLASAAVSPNKQNVSLTNSTKLLQNFTAGKRSFRFLAVHQVQTFIIACVPDLSSQ